MDNRKRDPFALSITTEFAAVRIHKYLVLLYDGTSRPVPFMGLFRRAGILDPPLTAGLRSARILV